MGLPTYGPNSFWPTVSVPEGLAAAGGGGAAVGTGVGAATAVGPVDGTAVGAAAVGAPGIAVGDAGRGVAVADDPQAKIAANKRAKGPRIMILGFFNQCFKMG